MGLQFVFIHLKDGLWKSTIAQKSSTAYNPKNNDRTLTSYFSDDGTGTGTGTRTSYKNYVTIAALHVFQLKYLSDYKNRCDNREY